MKCTREEARQLIRKNIPCTDYLTQKGSGYICPFCGSGDHGIGSTAAMHYYPDTNTWHCFSTGCEKTGDVLDLIAQDLATDYNGALKAAAAQLGIDILPGMVTGSIDDFPDETGTNTAPQKKPDKRQPEPPHDDFTEALEQAHSSLLATPAALEYMHSRGLSDAMIERYKIGYSAGGYNAVLQKFPQYQSKGQKAALYKYILPYPDSEGRLTYFLSEIIDRSQIDEYNGKYRKISHRSAEIFNARYLMQHDSPPVIFICEGVYDALSVEEAGGKAVAFVGTADKIFLQLCRDYLPTTTFVVSLDNDGPGRAAAERVKAGLQDMGYTFIEKTAQNGKDFNDDLKADRAGFSSFIGNTIAEALAAAAPAEQEQPADFLDRFISKIQTEAYRPYQTGLTFFDELLGGGVIPQSLLILMAPPGAGKTTLCQQISEAMAQNGKPVVYVNLEMSREQMLAKAISGRLGTNGCSMTTTQILQGYNWTEEQREAVLHELEEYRRDIYPLLKYNPDSITGDLDDLLQYLSSMGQKAAAAGLPAPAVILDYLHLISSRKNLDNQELLKQAVKGLKKYAIDFNTFVIAISATGRDSNKRSNMTMESARDSSNIEYTADYQLAINYWAAEHKTGDEPVTEVIRNARKADYWDMCLKVLKNRFGRPAVDVKAWFYPAGNRFYSEHDYLQRMSGDFDDLPEEWKEPPKAARRR